MSKVYLPAGWFIAVKESEGSLRGSVYIGMCTMEIGSPRYFTAKERVCGGDRLRSAVDSGLICGPFETKEEALRAFRPAPQVAPAPLPDPVPHGDLDLDDHPPPPAPKRDELADLAAALKHLRGLHSPTKAELIAAIQPLAKVPQGATRAELLELRAHILAGASDLAGASKEPASSEVTTPSEPAPVPAPVPVPVLELDPKPVEAVEPPAPLDDKTIVDGDQVDDLLPF